VIEAECAGIDYVDQAPQSLVPTSSQIRAARALLRWSADDLARESAPGLSTIKRAELADDQTSLTVANALAVRRTLEAAGVIFIDEDSSAGPELVREICTG